MTYRLYAHPLSSFCQKAIVAFYDTQTPFEFAMINFMEEDDVLRRFKALWPIAKMPLLEIVETGEVFPEATIIIEHLAANVESAAGLIPADPAKALQTRLKDRFFDLYLNVPMQKFNLNISRPADQKDPQGAAEARDLLVRALDVLEADMADRTWAIGEEFTMADCAAAPALYYAGLIVPFEESHPNVAAYFARLSARPSYARAFEESKPYLQYVPRL